MLNNIITALLLIACVLNTFLTFAYNSKAKEVRDLKQQLNNSQIKLFEKSNELSSITSKNYENKKLINDVQYEKTISNPPSSSPCIDPNSLQYLNNYISSTSSSKP